MEVFLIENGGKTLSMAEIKKPIKNFNF